MKNIQMGNIQTYQLQMIDSGGGGGEGVNYQLQIVTTKLPNENILTYQLQRGKLPNANCDQNTK